VSFQSWLPKNAFLSRAARTILSEPVAQWSEHWFARAPATIYDVSMDDDSEAPNLEVCGTRANIELSAASKRQLLETLLDTDLAKQKPSANEAEILDAMAADVGRDLLRRIEVLLSDADGGEGKVRVRYTLAIGEGAILDVVIPTQALAPLLKAQFGEPHSSPREFVRRNAALRQTSVTAEAILGQAELSLGEIDELAVGDVLVLDRSLSERVELRLPGSDRSFAQGNLRRNGNRISIQM
jgi:flagellar motor switch/type III secretory pathway protein FliN